MILSVILAFTVCSLSSAQAKYRPLWECKEEEKTQGENQQDRNNTRGHSLQDAI
jgi:hypothetical protein